MHLILYSKPGCHLCEGLQEKLEQIQSIQFELEVRDITSREDWFQAYQYEVPVLFLERRRQPNATGQELGEAEPASTLNPDREPYPVPRPSPRASVQQLERLLQKCLTEMSN